METEITSKPSDSFAVADPMITMSGGCAGYDIVFRGTASECIVQPARHGHVIIRDDEEQQEVAWEHERSWIYDDASIFKANDPAPNVSSTVFVIHDDNNESFTVKGVFDSYEKAFDVLPDHGHVIVEYEINQLDNGSHS